ncbi:MAG: histidinol dehydrogenase [Clostridiales bacterium]|jgi:histidinol dehydrogenase|nr:histidinol dehydrogenase [Clostridiales bacterium]
MAVYLKRAGGPAGQSDEETARAVSGIITRVRLEGDSALRAYNEEFDGYTGPIGPVPASEIRDAYKSLAPPLVKALLLAAANIKRFAEYQLTMFKDMEAELMPGVTLGHRVIPVSACACYVPGGRYPLPSSALMTVIPAKAAGVKRVAAFSPHLRGGAGGIEPATLAAMDIAGADEIYCLGGSQGVPAFAFGTATIAPADFIAGPGNRFVTEAKRQVFGQVGIDFVAGPSDVLIIADASGRADFIAADLLAQSEHDPLAKGVLLCTDRRLGLAVIKQVESLLETLPTREVAGQAWRANGQVRLCEDLREAARVANEAAPEHLELQVSEPRELLPLLNNYGSLFIGENSAEVYGDYTSGTNHILPTMGAARYTGGVWVGTFLKTVTHQRITAAGVTALAGAAADIARAEGLYGHKLAAELRIKAT